MNKKIKKLVWGLTSVKTPACAIKLCRAEPMLAAARDGYRLLINSHVVLCTFLF